MVSAPGSRTLEINVLSADNLCIDGKPATKNVYVVVRGESLNCFKTRTATVENAGSFPSWNETALVDMPAYARSITFEVKCKTSMGDKSIGLARIGLSDFLGGIVPESCLQFLSYRLRDWDGRRNGIINFSARVKTPAAEYNKPLVPLPVWGTAAPDKSSCGSQMRGLDDQKNSHGVVTGVPAYWNKYNSN